MNSRKLYKRDGHINDSDILLEEAAYLVRETRGLLNKEEYKLMGEQIDKKRRSIAEYMKELDAKFGNIFD